MVKQYARPHRYVRTRHKSNPQLTKRKIPEHDRSQRAAFAAAGGLEFPSRRQQCRKHKGDCHRECDSARPRWEWCPWGPGPGILAAQKLTCPSLGSLGSSIDDQTNLRGTDYIWWFQNTLTTEGCDVRLLAPSLGANLRHLAPVEVFVHGRFQAQESRQKQKR
jgi:hypothetical protein